MDAEHADGLPVTRRRPRISLLSLLLLTALAASATVTAVLWSEIGPLRAEVAGYRAELGRLDDRYPDRFQILRMEAPDGVDRVEWAWRLRPPADQDFRLFASEGPIPVDGYPRPSMRLTLLAGREHVLRVIAERDRDAGDWEVTFGWRREDGRADQAALRTRVAWRERSDFDLWGSVPFVTTTVWSDRKDTIGRVRTLRVNKDPAPGLMLWVEPVE